MNISTRNQYAEPPSPYWIESTPETNYPSLKEDINADVAIVGGGIVGITCAYLLADKGLSVVIIEADRILQGTTGHTTAKITSQHSLIYDKLKTQMGEEKARQYADANETAIRFIADTVTEHKIDCDLSWRPAYVYTQSEQYVTKIENDAKAASSLGIKASVVHELPLPFKIKAALRFDGQAQFHPLKYLIALVKTLPDSCRIFEQTRAVNIEEGKSTAVITNQGKKVMASMVVIASHYPFFDGGGMYFARVYPSRSYITGITISEKFPEGMFISAEKPTRSLRSQPMGDEELILVAGEDHKTGQSKNTSTNYDDLLQFAHHAFEVKDVKYRWSTQDYITLDGVPYVGNLTAGHPNLYVATGFAKWGISNGTASALIIRDLILHGDSPWKEVYTPSRFNATSALNFVVTNADVAKHLVAGKLKRAEDLIDLHPGEARVIEKDGDKIGAFRDDKGKLHMVDTTCTHMGCELSWNEAERSWDCPCHGSRFTYEGDIIEGPALSRLRHPGEGPNQVEPNVIQ
ncbi:MAG: FAD-dependent oxidoreductase [Bacillota bacterium]